jgi:hypothetical protein
MAPTLGEAEDRNDGDDEMLGDAERNAPTLGEGDERNAPALGDDMLGDAERNAPTLGGGDERNDGEGVAQDREGDGTDDDDPNALTLGGGRAGRKLVEGEA